MGKMAVVALVAVGVFVCMLFGAAADDAVELTEIYAAVSPSVLSIEAEYGRGEAGEGAGFVVDGAGHIVTNAHVVEGAESIRVIFADGREAGARLVGIDVVADIAVVKVDGGIGGLRALVFGDVDGLAVGQDVLAIGNPRGYGGTLTTGIISGLNREVEVEDGATMLGMIQTDAALHPGNSGGPLLNMAGEVIGIITLGYGSDNISFAIAADDAQRIVEGILERGEGLGALGIAGEDVDGRLREELCLPEGLGGLLIRGVLPDGAADAAGLREVTIIRDGEGPVYQAEVFDIITGINDRPIDGREGLTAYLREEAGSGEAVKLTLFRSEVLQMEEEIAMRLDYDNWFDKHSEDGFFVSDYGFAGMDAGEVYGDMEYGVLLIDVDEGSAAEDAGLRGFSYEDDGEIERNWGLGCAPSGAGLNDDIVLSVDGAIVEDMEGLFAGFAADAIRPWSRHINEDTARVIRREEGEGVFLYSMLDERYDGREVMLGVYRSYSWRGAVDVPLILR